MPPADASVVPEPAEIRDGSVAAGAANDADGAPPVAATAAPGAVTAPRTRRAPFFRASRLALWATALLIVFTVGNALMIRLTRIEPPPPEPGRELPVDLRGAHPSVGPSWISRDRGLWELHLEGDPYSMGWAHTRLAGRLLFEADDYMFREMARYVPSSVAMWLIRAGVRVVYRHLADHIPDDRLRELAGEARGYPDLHADFLPTFHRLVYYHALHDITQGIEHSPLLGCSAFAASGKATTDGHLIVGRNFDFEGPEPFDKDKIVQLWKPTGKIPFASVAWAGMSGVVTGLNVEGVYVSLNAARTDDKGAKGHAAMPVEILVREVLENAHTLDEAIAFIRARPVMVPDFYLVADGKSGESAVIERSPDRFEVRRSKESGDTLALTNHALTPAFAGDKENERLKSGLTSGARYARLRELVDGARGHIDPVTALAILRDRQGAGGAPLGLGNRNALDALIATHSVVVDATDRILWVGVGPHLAGKYVGFDLRKELLGEPRPDPADLPADPIFGALLDSPSLRAYHEATAELKLAESLRARDPVEAASHAARAAHAEDAMPEPHLLLGDLLRAADPVGSRREYQRFLDLSPPYRADVDRARAALTRE